MKMEESSIFDDQTGDLPPKKITHTDLRKMFTSELGENLCNSIPPWFFNYWWRFINLQDDKTAILKLPTVLQHTAYKIAVPLTLSASLLNLFIHALRSKDVGDLLKQHHYKPAIKLIGLSMVTEAKNPETIFNAIYSFGTCVSWTLGNAAFVWVASEYDNYLLSSMIIGAAGAVSGYLTGAFVVGVMWGGANYVYQKISKPEETNCYSLKERSWQFFKNSLKELPGLAVCSGMSSLNLSASMDSLPAIIRNSIDASIVATASSLTNGLQMVGEKIFFPSKQLPSEREETTPLLSKKDLDIEKVSADKSKRKSYYRSGFTVFDSPVPSPHPAILPNYSLKKLSN